MDKIKKVSRKLLLFVLLILSLGQTGVLTSLSGQTFAKKFDISNIKTLLLEKARTNRNLLFLLGAAGLLSFISWKVYQARKRTPQVSMPEEPPVVVPPLLFIEPVIKGYYDMRVTVLKKLIQTQRSEEKMNQIFADAAKNHARYVQYDQGKLPDGLPEEIMYVMKKLLDEFGLSEKNVAFALSRGKINDSFVEVSIDNNVNYKLVIHMRNIEYYNVLKKELDVIMIKQYFKILSDFVDCLGSITSKRLCFQNEIDTLQVQDEAQFSLNQHLAFLSHIASLFYSRTAADIKTAYQYLSFKPSSYEKLPMQDIRHFFSTELQSKLSLGTLFLSTFDYARYLEIVGNVIDFSMFERMNWLPDIISGLLKQISDKEKPNSQINKFVFDYFVFDSAYQSFSVQEGFMKKIGRLPNLLKKPIDLEKNKVWLDNEIARLDQGFRDTLPGFDVAHARVKQTEKDELGEKNRKTPNIEIDNQIPICMQAMMKMFLQRYAEDYDYKNYKIKIMLEDLKDCGVGFSEIDLDSKAWRIKLCISQLHDKGVWSYFSILNIFLHELGHLINRDVWVKTWSGLSKDQPFQYNIHREWAADQRLALRDKDVAEIFFVTELLRDYPTSEAPSELHPGGGARFLRSFDIAKHYNIIPDDVLGEKRSLLFSDIQPIFAKHGLYLKSFEPEYEFKSMTAAYIQHKDATTYESFVHPHLRTDKSTKKRRITYQRIP